ncbi:hypothetical protein NE237_026815 [Protea cynaroides]|uniref:Pectinesterase inhibitor domain-containing protein n=1 Tax=Protea cynaroides TaxID=273540 RepID=A0A9Q0JTT7_9MAGN|nr:hypothetical protein NE237_026815 [Protea cynaroides]
MKQSFSFFVVLVILFFAAVDADIVSDTCQKVAQGRQECAFRLRVKVLGADPKSHKIDLHGLGLISLNLIESNETKIESRIGQLLNDQTKGFRCQERLTGIDASSDCEDGFKGFKSPLTRRTISRSKHDAIFFFFFILVVLFLAVVDADIINDTCQKTTQGDKNVHLDFCVKVLGENPKSHIVDLQGLGIISLNLIKSNATNIGSRIRQLLNDQTVAPDVKKGLQACQKTYSNASSNIKEAIGAFNSKDYNTANVKSHNTDLQGLGLISLNLIVSTETKIESRIGQLLNDRTVALGVKKGLQACQETYSDASDNTKEAIVAFNSKDYDTANIKISAAMDASSDCEDGFKGFKSPLTAENNSFFQLTAIALAIINLL